MGFDSVTIRLRGAGLYGWVGVAALLAFIGVFEVVDGSRSIGAPLFVCSVLVLFGHLRVRCTFGIELVTVTNRLRTVSVAWSEIKEIERRRVTAPLMRGTAWNELVLVLRDGSRVPIVASTGLGHSETQRVLDLASARGAS